MPLQHSLKERSQCEGRPSLVLALTRIKLALRSGLEDFAQGSSALLSNHASMMSSLQHVIELHLPVDGLHWSRMWLADGLAFVLSYRRQAACHGIP